MSRSASSSGAPRCRALRRAVVVLGQAVVIWVLGGCYRYAPVDELPGAGSEVRIHLTDEGIASLGPVLGAGTTNLSGRIVSASDSTLVVSVSETGRGDSHVSWAGERITLPRSTLARAERRSLDRWRTVGVGAAGLGAAGLVSALVKELGSRSGGDGDGTVVIPP